MFNDLSYRETAQEFLIALLGTYRDENNFSDSISDLAKKAIINAIANPDTLLFENLLDLKPINSQINSFEYKLLHQFLEGNVETFTQFANDYQADFNRTGTLRSAIN